MKTNKTFAYGFLTVILALAFIACPDEKTSESNPPVAKAQAEPTHTLADNLTITLDGTDSTGNISAYAWECESYTADQGTVSAEYSKAQVNALITNANAETATVKPRKAGTYKFKLTVTDDKGESDTDTVTVVVKGYTVSANITIPEITFTINNNLSNLSVLDFTPNYSGYDDPVFANRITYSITATGTNYGTNDILFTYIWYSTDADFEGRVFAKDLQDTILTIFTQIFYFDGEEIPEMNRSLTTMVMGPNSFASFVGDNASEDYLSATLPALSISLSETITELP